MTLPWYPFLWANYSNKTMHLSQGQHGAYILFLHWIYTTETPIPHKQRYSIARATLDLERSDASLVLDQFFTRKGQNWHNEKAEEVMTESHQKHQRYVTAGQLGGLKKASNASSDATPTLEQRSTNHTYQPIEGSKNLLNGLVVGKKNGRGNGAVTISDPQERLSRFQKTLAEKPGGLGWLIVSAASDPTHTGHLAALEHCRARAKEIGKGWPQQWPA